MAIISNAGQTVLALRNRPTATPPIMFSDFGPGKQFSFCIWAKVIDNTIPESLIAYQGIDGSRFVISAQKGFWLFEVRNESAVLNQSDIGVLQINTWYVFCVVVNNENIKVYRGTEIDFITPVVPVHAPLFLNSGWPFAFTFAHIAMVASHNMAICNFRYFDIALDPSEIDIHINRWAVNGPKIPKWSSTLRLPGDISNIAGVYTSSDWASGHEFTTIAPDISNLKFHTPDPQWLAGYEPCPVWLYKIPALGLFVGHNPGTVPSVPTTYKAVDKFRFEDRGTVPVGPLESVYYVAYPFTTGVGPGPVSSWPLYLNEGETEVPIDFGDPNMRFEVDTNVAVPNSIICPNMYLWQFGGQFTWTGGASVPSGTGNIGYPYLYTTYIGFPPGVPTVITIDDLAGLFAIKKGTLIDQYYRSTKRKIPDPTIRTAYIGE